MAACMHAHAHNRWIRVWRVTIMFPECPVNGGHVASTGTGLINEQS